MADPDDRIGMFVTRYEIGVRRVTKPHLVDSMVDGEPFTRCGRRLRKLRDRQQFRYEAVPALRVCKWCSE